MQKLLNDNELNRIADLGIAVVDRLDGLTESSVFMGFEMRPGVYAVLDFDNPNDAVDLDEGTIWPTAEIAREKVYSLDHPIKMHLHPIPAKAALRDYAETLANFCMEQLMVRDIVESVLPPDFKLAA